MRAFVLGATGVLGRRIVRQLVERGHAVVGLSRRPENDAAIRSLGGEPRTADPFDVASLARAAEGADIVIHAATKIPVKPRTRPEDWAENDRIRRDGIRALLRATAQARVRRYLQQSIVWVARPADESAFDEDSTARNAGRNYQSMIDGEALVREGAARHGFGASILRLGAFYSSDSAHVRRIAEGLTRRRLPILGDGQAVWRLLHAEDAASAFVAVTEGGRDGLWHIVDDEPVAVGTFLKALADRLNAPPPRRIPRWLARLVAGREVTAFFTDSTRTSSARLRKDFGWSPRFPSYREGLAEIVAQWTSEGFPPKGRSG